MIFANNNKPQEIVSQWHKIDIYVMDNSHALSTNCEIGLGVR